jgi:hypothetical protein
MNYQRISETYKFCWISIHGQNKSISRKDKKSNSTFTHTIHLLNLGCLHPVALVISYDVGFNPSTQLHVALRRRIKTHIIHILTQVYSCYVINQSQSSFRSDCENRSEISQGLNYLQHSRTHTLYFCTCSSSCSFEQGIGCRFTNAHVCHHSRRQKCDCR